MDKKEIIGRSIAGDPRVYNAMQEARKTDKSFTERGFLGIPITYSQLECREFWFQAMQIGMQEGLRMGSLEQQKIDTMNSCKNDRHKEFYTKFLKLAEEYNCAIAYHPIEGMCVIDVNKHLL